MSIRFTGKRAVSAFLVVVAALPAVAQAGSADDAFYKAYYLEHEKGDYAAAADLYAKVAGDRSADAALRDEAKARLSGCREELATSDFASLMPPQTLAYIELNRPGDQLALLIEQLGLLADPAGLAGPGGNRVAISPELLKGALGLRGAAVALTGIDPFKQEPVGVAVFHPGNVDVIRGLIETGLPIGGESVEAIAGYPTYRIEDKVYVTLTSRLVVVSNQRGLIKGVIQRMTGDDAKSFADDPTMASVIADRGDDALLFFCVNAKKLMPVVSGMMAMGAAKSPELAMANAVLDLNSMEAIAGHVGIGEDGVRLDVSLRLAQGHRNLVYNLFRMPAITKDTFKYIPDGVAAFVAASLNEPTYSIGRTRKPDNENPPIVTAMDFGREIFGNIVSLAIFALPPDGSEVAGKHPMPDVAAVITVNDTSKSEALWTQILGIVSVATGKAPMEGVSQTIGEVQVRSYAMPEGVTIYLATVDHEMLIATSKNAVARSIQAKRTGASVLGDAKFAPVKRRIGKDTTRVIFIHPKRCAEIGKLFMGPDEIAEIEPWVDAMEDTVVSLVINHSDRELRLSAQVSGIPDVGDLVSAKIMEEKQRAKQYAKTRAEQRNKLRTAINQGNLDEITRVVETPQADKSAGARQLRDAFDAIAVNKGDPQAAAKIGDAILKLGHDEAKELNNFAWALLTEDKYRGEYAKLALKLSQRSNEITDHGNWMFVDTLAMAKFKTGDAGAAVKLQKKAIELLNALGADELQARLARFQTGQNRER